MCEGSRLTRVTRVVNSAEVPEQTRYTPEHSVALWPPRGNDYPPRDDIRVQPRP